MVIEPTEVRVAEGGTGHAVELDMPIREGRQIIVGNGVMIFAGPVRIEQQEVLCSKDLQKGIEAAIAEAESHIRAGDDPGVVVGGDLIPSDWPAVGPVTSCKTKRCRPLPED